jgi:hypothetical protein
MNTLHLFGDSFTEGHNLDLHYPNYKIWKEWRGGNLPNTWAELLSDKMGMEMNMKAIGGMSNPEIFQTICNECQNFKKDDIVIINWAYMDRFRWASYFINDDGNYGYDVNNEKVKFWLRLSSKQEDGHYISESTRNEIAVNRTHPLHVDEIYDFENIIDILCKNVGCNVYYWTSDNSLIIPQEKEKLFQKKYILHNLLDVDFHANTDRPTCLFESLKKFGFKYIYEETNNEVGDHHPSEKGHETIYRLFYEYITKWNNIKS